MRRLCTAISDGPPWRGAILFAVLFLALALPRLSRPPAYVFDEVYQAFTAGRYAAGDRDAYVWATRATGAPEHCAYEWVHPPLAKLVLTGSILVLGDGPFGWRLPCGFAGAALVALAYVVARRMLPVRGAAELAALALATDGMVLVMSRTAMSDIFVALFVFAAYASFWRWLCARWPEGESGQHPPDARATTRRLYLTGGILGVAVATKWFGLLAWGWIGLVVGAEAVAAAAAGLRRGSSGGRALLGIAHVALAMIAIPACIYLACYIPFFAQGYTMGDLGELLRQQVHYHTTLTAQHDYASAWWSWPLLLRSVWLWTGTQDGIHRDVYAIGNPAFWWAALPVLLALVVQRARAFGRGVPIGGHAGTVILLGFLGQWVPWALPRRPAFLYYLLSALPFAALAVAWMAALAARRIGRAGSVVRLGYALALVAFAAWLYPLWTGLPLGEAAYKARLLLPGWK